MRPVEPEASNPATEGTSLITTATLTGAPNLIQVTAFYFRARLILCGSGSSAARSRTRCRFASGESGSTASIVGSTGVGRLRFGDLGDMRRQCRVPQRSLVGVRRLVVPPIINGSLIPRRVSRQVLTGVL